MKQKSTDIVKNLDLERITAEVHQISREIRHINCLTKILEDLVVWSDCERPLDKPVMIEIISKSVNDVKDKIMDLEHYLEFGD